MSRLLSDLHPLIRPLCTEHQACANCDPGLMAKGLIVELIETFRDDTAQREAFLKGRDPKTFEVIDRAAIVTRKPPGASWHNIRTRDMKPAALAYHLALSLGGKLVGFPGGAPMDDAAYLQLGVLGETLGLTWGGRWKDPHDPCHFELHPNGATLSQTVAAMRMGRDPGGPVA